LDIKFFVLLLERTRKESVQMIAKEYTAKILSALPEEDDVSSHAEEFAAREAQPLMASILEAANEENPDASPEHVKEIAEDVWLSPARVKSTMIC
jgi:hypothetical protein